MFSSAGSFASVLKNYPGRKAVELPLMILHTTLMRKATMQV
jgi:hypothetical protein